MENGAYKYLNFLIVRYIIIIYIYLILWIRILLHSILLSAISLTNQHFLDLSIGWFNLSLVSDRVSILHLDVYPVWVL